MAAKNGPKSIPITSGQSKKRKQRYLPHNKPVKKKGSYPLRPGVEGFFITCDGGRERQASHEAINVIDSFFEELLHGRDSCGRLKIPNKPLNKKITFSDSDSSSSDDDSDDNEVEVEEGGKLTHKDGDASEENVKSDKSDPLKDDLPKEKQAGEETNANNEDAKNEIQATEAEEPPAKKQFIAKDASKCVIQDRVEKSIDKLIEAELVELGDKSKRRFFNLDSGCNGVVFIQMRKKDGEPGPKDIVQHMMTSVATSRKHMSRFILRVLPVEVACYASEEEISRSIKPLVGQYFPGIPESPQKFAVLYEARANTGIDRMKIISTVAKSVPEPHKVDLNDPDKTIVVQIIKTICLIGVVEKYKELSKYNLRQLTSTIS